MRWAKTSLRNSFFGWKADKPVAESTDDLETIRNAMLQALMQAHGAHHGGIERRVLFARDLDELWYARPDLMTALAASRGESVARDQLAGITALFEARMPERFRRASRPTTTSRR